MTAALLTALAVVALALLGWAWRRRRTRPATPAERALRAADTPQATRHAWRSRH